jgi:hypothetical protein
MGRPPHLKKKDPNRVVKCGCGSVMRVRDWIGHWNGCRVARMGGEPTAEEVASLEQREQASAQAEKDAAWPRRKNH